MTPAEPEFGAPHSWDSNTRLVYTTRDDDSPKESREAATEWEYGLTHVSPASS